MPTHEQPSATMVPSPFPETGLTSTSVSQPSSQGANTATVVAIVSAAIAVLLIVCVSFVRCARRMPAAVTGHQQHAIPTQPTRHLASTTPSLPNRIHRAASQSNLARAVRQVNSRAESRRNAFAFLDDFYDDATEGKSATTSDYSATEVRTFRLDAASSQREVGGEAGTVSKSHDSVRVHTDTA
ncbi:hypothetical protein BC830DRAFT_413118 [Chytriomyces sp. MP71]|nr:hypothetical protein BC830DRAFT_413118 [Chytriomyces sp. MP71]